jgi:regulator of CtrA degradation
VLKVARERFVRTPSTMDSPPTAFFGKTYDEALSLLEEARGYLSVLEPLERRHLDVSERLKLCTETMRMTARLTQVMAWLLTQRAVHEGEMTEDQALADTVTLADVDICMEHEEAGWEGLPRRLVGLLDRSERLYLRVARLDELARRRIN